jgi:zinc D-Ala-D-Ala dipeptidase
MISSITMVIKKWLSATVVIGIFGWSNVSTDCSASPQNANTPQSAASRWVELPNQSKKDGNQQIDISFPYATKANFVRTQLYPCARCFLRPEVATAVQLAHRKLQRQGYGGLRLFDCYRPRSVQREMWRILPDSRYVGNPDRGSDHNRGMAIDATILDRAGKPLDLGTEFDDFSTKAHHTYRKLSPQVLKNRDILKKTMISVGFRPLDTEWWHYAWNGNKASIGDWVWKCQPSSNSRLPKPDILICTNK